MAHNVWEMSVIKPEGHMYALYAERVLRNLKY